MTTTAHNEILVSLDGNIIAALPIELEELAATIEQSKYLLALEHNFDAEDKTTPFNIPAGGEPATFYGDNYGSQVTGGKFDPTQFQQALLPDLSLISA